MDEAQERLQLANLLDLVENSTQDVIDISLERNFLKKLVRNYHYFLKDMDAKGVCLRR